MFILSLLDIALNLFPFDLFNPAWEFQTAGVLMERIPVPLMSLGLILLGKNRFRKSWEKLALRGLSWGSLITGILICLILIPAVVVTSYTRLADQLDAQYNDRFRSQVAQSAEIKDQLDNANADEISNFFKQQNPEKADVSPAKARKQLIESLGEAQNQVRSTLIQEKNKQLLIMRKSTFKWMLTAFISGIALILLWRWSSWAR